MVLFYVILHIICSSSSVKIVNHKITIILIKYIPITNKEQEIIEIVSVGC
jgi:hypothetical protein